ncbi:HAMP domain-containing histidine kinase, partial [Bacteroidales bacterium OttesenSCG-928-A17]|nr:HAMP domain-containing histidine kinase [Bacteroidales bacterium OttesenSCG-928-A17]
MKYVKRLDISDLDSIFRGLLHKENILFNNTAIEFYDKDIDSTYHFGNIKKSLANNIYETEMLYVDLINTIGLKAYVEAPVYAIFKKMLLQLSLSIILIIASVICLFRLSFTIFLQRKEHHIKQNFVNAMTHELKRPISSTLTMLQYLHDQIKEDDFSSIEEYISDSVFSLKKLDSYIEKIQEISKGKENKIEFEWEMINLKSFFSQLKNKYESRSDKKINYRLEIPDDTIIKTDKLHLTNIIENLTENSIKYSDELLNIDIRIRKTDNYFTISHRDNGWGISDSEINTIFDAFYRGYSTKKRRKSGFGLGLSYVKQTINGMGGNIEVTSEEEKFTEFIVKLPV